MISLDESMRSRVTASVCVHVYEYFDVIFHVFLWKDVEALYTQTYMHNNTALHNIT